MKIKTNCTKPLCLIAGLLLLAGAIGAKAATYTWNIATGTADWTTPASWNSAGYPNAAGDVANITKTLTGAMNVTLGTSVTVGSMTIGGSANNLYTLGASGGNTITLNNNGAGALITIAGQGSPNTIAAPLVIADAGGLMITNTGGQSRAQIVSGGITGTGNLTIGDGRTGGSSSAITYQTGSINNVGTLTVNSVTVLTKPTVISSIIGANVTTFTKLGAAALTISAANLYTGATTISAGTLTLGIANAIPSSSSVSVASGAILSLNGLSDNIGGLSGAGTVDATVAGTNTLDIGNNGSGGTFSGVLKNTLGTLSLTKSGAGTEVLSGANTYSGTTTINGGILNAGVAEVASTSGPFGKPTTGAGSLVFNGGTLQYSGANNTDYSARFSGTAIKIDVNGASVSFGTALPGTAALTLSDTAGSGKLSLTVANTYSGNTIINGGTLALSGSGALASGSSVNIGAGGTFDVSALASPYNFGSSATLTASGTGTSSTTAATIVPASGGTFDLGLRPITLTWGGASSGTDSTHPSLVVSQGTLNFNNNTVTVAVPGMALGVGTYTLVSGSTISGAPSVTPTFSGSGKVSGTSASLSVVGGNTLVLSVFTAGTSAVWTDGSSLDNNWSTPGNWLGGVVPSAAEDTATFGNTVSAVTLDTAETIGTLVFNQAASYTISGSSILTFDSLGGGGTITVSAGTANTVQPPVKLTDNTTVNFTAGTSLTLSGIVANTSGSRTLTLSGAGTTVLGSANTYGPSSGLGTTLNAGGTLQIGNSTALGLGDLSVSGNSKIQAGAALSMANNIAIADATALDNNGNDVTLSGVISGGGALTKTSNHTLTLTGNNTYAGGTTNTTGQLNINNGGSSAANSAIGTGPLTIGGGTIDNTSAGDVTLLPAIAQNWNGDFTYVGTHNLNLGSGAVTLGASRQVTVSANTLTVGGVISGTSFGLTKAGNGTLVLNGANTFGGTTLISAGTLLLGNSAALQKSTLNYSSGTLSFGSLTAATLGGLSGSQDISLVNGSSAAVALTVGGNNASTSYSGNLSGSGSLTMNGTGTLTLGNANYTGSTTVSSSGTVTINGGSFGSSSSTIAVATTGGGTATLNYSGSGTVTASTVSVGSVNSGASGSSMTITGGASANFSALNLGLAGNYFGNFTVNTTGTVGLGAVTDYKDSNGGGPAGNTSGLVISAGTVTATSVIQANSTGSGTMNIVGGSLAIGNSSSSGAFNFGAGTTATRGGYVMVYGGSLTYLGTDGLLMGVAAATQPNAIAISGGTATLTGITLNSASTGVSSSLTNTGTGTLYLGGVGLVNVSGNTAAIPVTLGGTSTLGAIADWSSSVPIALTGTPTIEAADSSAVAHNITLSGILSGAGALTKTGTGTLTLSTAETYTGATTVSAGTLALSGSGSIATPLISVSSGATFDVSGLTSALFNLGSSQTLSNNASATGTLNGNVATGSGTVAVTFSGTPALTIANGSLTLAANTVFRVNNTGLTLALGSYKLISKSAGGTVAAASTLPAVTVGGNGAASVATLKIITGELWLNVVDNKLDLVSSAQTNGYLASVTFTASVQTNGVMAGDATGTVTFYTNSVAYATNGLAGGTANISVSTLPRGTNLIAAIYSGDGNYLPSTNSLPQVVTNHPPVAGNVTCTRNTGIYSLRITISDLLTNVTDADGDAITLVTTGVSTNGIVLAANGTNYLNYYNTSNVNDQFSYTVTDGFGGTNSGIVSIVVSNSVTGQITGQFTSFTNNAASLTFHGIPNYSYVTERSTNLTDWVDVMTNTAATNGVINVMDHFSDLGSNAPSSAYYRLRYQP